MHGKGLTFMYLMFYVHQCFFIFVFLQERSEGAIHIRVVGPKLVKVVLDIARPLSRSEQVGCGTRMERQVLPVVHDGSPIW